LGQRSQRTSLLFLGSTRHSGVTYAVVVGFLRTNNGHDHPQGAAFARCRCVAPLWHSRLYALQTTPSDRALKVTAGPSTAPFPAWRLPSAICRTALGFLLPGAKVTWAMGSPSRQLHPCPWPGCYTSSVHFLMIHSVLPRTWCTHSPASRCGARQLRLRRARPPSRCHICSWTPATFMPHGGW